MSVRFGSSGEFRQSFATSTDRQAGGHVDDEVIDDVEVEAQELHGVEIIVSHITAFQGAELVLLGSPQPTPAR